MRCFALFMFVVLAFPPLVYPAATKFAQEVMLNYLKNDRAGLAMLNAPYVSSILT